MQTSTFYPPYIVFTDFVNSQNQHGLFPQATLTH